jgi:hypothetical protein
MPDSQTLNMHPRMPDTQNNRKCPFFALDNFAVSVHVTIHSNENCKDWMTSILKKLITHAINKNVGNENSNCIQKLYTNTCISL